MLRKTTQIRILPNFDIKNTFLLFFFRLKISIIEIEMLYYNSNLIPQENIRLRIRNPDFIIHEST